MKEYLSDKKNLVKVIGIGVAALLVIAAIVWGILSLFVFKTRELETEHEGQVIYSYIDTRIVCTADGENLDKRVNEDKSRAIQGFLNKKVEIESETECVCSGDIQIRVAISDKEEHVYYLADDGCNILKYNGKYYRYTVSDKHIINDIFEEYGVELAAWDKSVYDAHGITDVGATTATVPATEAEKSTEAVDNQEETEANQEAAE